MGFRALVAAALLLAAPPGHAITIVIASFPTPVIQLVVGSFGSTIDQVSFNVPANRVGDGTPVVGSPPVRIIMLARAAPVNSRIVGLVANSSIPLSNGTSSVPFSTIGWTASDADIPSGTFNGAFQLLTTFFNSRVVFNTHTFSYSNAQVLSPGSYTGRVTYTLVMP